MLLALLLLLWLPAAWAAHTPTTQRPWLAPCCREGDCLPLPVVVLQAQQDWIEVRVGTAVFWTPRSRIRLSGDTQTWWCGHQGEVPTTGNTRCLFLVAPGAPL